MKINKKSMKIWKIIGIILLIITIIFYFQNKFYSGAYFITIAYIYTISLFVLIMYIIASFIILIYKLIKNKK